MRRKTTSKGKKRNLRRKRENCQGGSLGGGWGQKKPLGKGLGVGAGKESALTGGRRGTEKTIGPLNCTNLLKGRRNKKIQKFFLDKGARLVKKQGQEKQNLDRKNRIPPCQGE